MSPRFSIVVAADEANGIGANGDLPFRLPGDIAFFRKLTSTAEEGKQNAVVMGKKTYASIPPKFRPLPKRLNVVLSRGPQDLPEGVLAAASLDDALAQLARREHIDRVFVIGGGEIYALALRHSDLARIHLTRVHARFACDTFLPAIDDRFKLVKEDGPHDEQGVRYTFQTYER